MGVGVGNVGVGVLMWVGVDRGDVGVVDGAVLV